MLAVQINADKFFILTDVPKVYLNFNTPQEKALDRVTIAEAKKYLEGTGLEDMAFPDDTDKKKV